MEKGSFSEIAHMSTLKPEEIDDEELEELGESSEEEEPEKSGVTYTEPEKQEEERRVEHTGRIHSITAVPTESDMKKFLFSHTYLNASGIFALALTLAAVVLVVYNIVAGEERSILAIVMGILIVFLMGNSALSIYRKAKQYAQDLAENPGHRITYKFSDAGFDLSRGDEYAGHDWSDITKVREGGTCYYIYMGSRQAFALPKEQLEDESAFRALIVEKVSAEKLKLAKR